MPPTRSETSLPDFTDEQFGFLDHSGITSQQFGELLIKSGLVAEDLIRNTWQSLDKTKRTPVNLAIALSRQNSLTPLQAQMVIGGDVTPPILGGYVIEAKLGEGGMGKVYRAVHKKMKREVALKVISPAMLRDASALERFNREVEAAARLSHPNIVTSHDAGEADGMHYLVMEYVAGSDLMATIQRSGPLSTAEAVDYTLQAARGLAYAHRAGIVHRDIKPANLLLDSAGAIKILDMGLARLERPGDETADQGLTHTGVLMGTIDYMAPEQALDSKTADARSDIYSLGCTMFFLLTARAMYNEDTVMKRLLAHRDQAIPKLSSELNQRMEPNGTSQMLDAVFQRMVAKDPGDRFATMDEVVQALQAVSHSINGSKPVMHGHLQPQPTALLPSADIAPRSLTKSSDSMDVTVALDESPRSKADSTPLGAAISKQAKASSRRNWLVIATGFLAVVILSTAITFKFRGKDGAVLIELDGNPDIASIEIDGKSVAFSPDGTQKRLTFSVDPGKYKLSIKTTDGLELATNLGKKPLEIRAGANATLRAWIERNTDDHTWDLPPDAPPPAISPFSAESAKEHQEAWAKHLGIPVDLENSIGMKFRLIPPGEFLMGSSEKEIENAIHEAKWREPGIAHAELIQSEGPQHKVALTGPFLMSQHEVTRGNFGEFIKATGYKTDAESNSLGGLGYQGGNLIRDPGFLWNASLGFATEQSDTHPVVNVSWNDAVAFCKWLSDKEEAMYRLPTEAEWEFVCLAGNPGPFNFGDDSELLAEYAWHDRQGGIGTKPVGTKRPNALGVSDMHGNVMEMCSDCFGPYTAALARDPYQRTSSSLRVLRGGAFFSAPFLTRATHRRHVTSAECNHVIGFRVVKTMKYPDKNTPAQ
ncbi:MAG: SUMF1/EgtB/PvdO family nonheme iron enzyme [Planctomycetales bacterium]|nr:SUMF1/EgtB/PvdO family nonheme iron enzyme [Planctomycetales bacterium]